MRNGKPKTDKPPVTCPHCGGPAQKADTFERDGFYLCMTPRKGCPVLYFAGAEARAEAESAT